MKRIESNYAVISGGKITLSNKKPSISCIGERLLENVSIVIFSDYIEIYGDEFIYGFSFDGFWLDGRTDIDNKYVTNSFSFSKFKKMPFVKSGWYGYKETEPTKIIINKYIINL